MWAIKENDSLRCDVNLQSLIETFLNLITCFSSGLKRVDSLDMLTTRFIWNAKSNSHHSLSNVTSANSFRNCKMWNSRKTHVAFVSIRNWFTQIQWIQFDCRLLDGFHFDAVSMSDWLLFDGCCTSDHVNSQTIALFFFSCCWISLCNSYQRRRLFCLLLKMSQILAIIQWFYALILFGTSDCNFAASSTFYHTNCYLTNDSMFINFSCATEVSLHIFPSCRLLKSVSWANWAKIGNRHLVVGILKFK